MLMSEVLKEYGDFNLSDTVLAQMGIEKPKSIDVMLDYKQVRALVKGNPYSIIGRLKSKYRCDYEEMLIPLLMLCDHYHLKPYEAYEKLKEDSK